MKGIIPTPKTKTKQKTERRKRRYISILTDRAVLVCGKGFNDCN